MILDLFDPLSLQPADNREHTIQRRFEAFDRKHPEVYDELVKLARQVLARGVQHYGIKALFEVLRYHRMIRGLPDEVEDFKLNNNYTSRYARLIMRHEPDLKGFFETRELKT